MESQDEIVDIPKTMERFFGCAGKMLQPSPATVAAVIVKIPKGWVITIDALCKKLAKDFKTEVACPATTEKSLCLAAATSIEENLKLPYWRVLKKSGELNAKYPHGIEGQAAHLIKEGHVMVATKKSKTVSDFEQRNYSAKFLSGL